MGVEAELILTRCLYSRYLIRRISLFLKYPKSDYYLYFPDGETKVSAMLSLRPHSCYGELQKKITSNSTCPGKNSSFQCFTSPSKV